MKHPKPQLLAGAAPYITDSGTRIFHVKIADMPHAGPGDFFGRTKFAAYRWAVRVHRQDLAMQVATALRGRK